MPNKSANIFYFIFPALLLVALTIVALVEYPVILENAKSTVFTTFVGLSVYFIFWLSLRPDIFSRNGGLLIGLFFVLNISIEDFIDWQTKTSTLISTLVMMALIFISFSIIGAIKTLQAKSFLQGIKSAFISALLGTLIALCFGFLICYLFGSKMIGILKNDPGHEKYANLKAFIFFNAFDNASNHLVVAPIVSIIMGSLGGIVALVILRVKKSK